MEIDTSVDIASLLLFVNQTALLIKMENVAIIKFNSNETQNLMRNTFEVSNSNSTILKIGTLFKYKADI